MTTLTIKLQAAKTTQSWQLALDKFPFNLDETNRPMLSNPDSKSIKFNRLKSIQKSYQVARKSLETAAQRQQAFLATLEAQYGARFRRITLVNPSRLLLHLGRSSVLENVGLYCERVSGLPIIPGTAVKGVVSTWACWEGNLEKDEFSADRSDLFPEATQILGSNSSQDKSVPSSAGNIVFIGGFPQTKPNLEIDIVTPHPDEGRGRITPNPFLAVSAGTHWSFPLLASSRVSDNQAIELLDCASRWLEDCLTQAGIGAKTAAGYGNFRSLTPNEVKADTAYFQPLAEKAKDELKLGTMTSEDQKYYKFVQSVTDWAPLARDIGNKSEPDKSYILRFFRSEDGQIVIKNWPNNKKAKARKEALKDAGL